ncbi:MAG: CDP-alcohol phosphatidyltransferase family protein [Candidatus Micrarchaeota archaeon]
MMKKVFKKQTQEITTRAGKLFSRVPVSPNAWTALSLLVALVGFFALALREMLLGLILFIFAAALDAIDGAVARAARKTTRLGAYLDGMVDRFVEALLLFGLMAFGLPEFVIPGYGWLALLLFLGTCMTSYARAYADHRKAIDEKEVEKMGGARERAERLLLIFLAMCAWFFEPVYATYLIALATALAFVTVIQRVGFVVGNARA